MLKSTQDLLQKLTSTPESSPVNRKKANSIHGDYFDQLESERVQLERNNKRLDEILEAYFYAITIQDSLEQVELRGHECHFISCSCKAFNAHNSDQAFACPFFARLSLEFAELKTFNEFIQYYIDINVNGYCHRIELGEQGAITIDVPLAGNSTEIFIHITLICKFCTLSNDDLSIICLDCIPPVEACVFYTMVDAFDLARSNTGKRNSNYYILSENKIERYLSSFPCCVDIIEKEFLIVLFGEKDDLFNIYKSFLLSLFRMSSDYKSIKETMKSAENVTFYTFDIVAPCSLDTKIVDDETERFDFSTFRFLLNFKGPSFAIDALEKRLLRMGPKTKFLRSKNYAETNLEFTRSDLIKTSLNHPDIYCIFAN